MRQIWMTAMAGLALTSASHASAQMAEKACSGPAVAPPAELAGWISPIAIAASGDAPGDATLEIGKAVSATLKPTGDVHYPMRPEKPGGTVSYGGLFAFTVAEPGTYRIALGAGAWIDVVRDGKPIASTAHGHGPDCSGIRKMVDFQLERGRYVLQIAANGTPGLTLMIARLS